MQKKYVTLITNKESNIQIMKDIISNLVSSLTGNMFSFSLGLMLLNTTHSPLSFGLEMIVMPLTNLLFVVPIGNLVDSFNRKKIILISLIVRIFALITLFSTINSFKNNYLFIPITLFVVVNTMCSSINSTAYSAAVHELVNENHIQKLSSFTQAANSLSAIIAPPLGMGVYALLGFKTMISLEVFATTFSLVIVLTMHFHQVSSQKVKNSTIITAKSNVSRQFKKFLLGFEYIRKQKIIMEMIIIGTFVNFFFTSLTIGMPYIIINELHLGNGPVSFLESGNSLGMLLGSLVISIIPDNISLKTKLFGSLIPTLLSFIGLGISFILLKNYLMISIVGTILMFCIGFSLILLNIATQVYLQKNVPSALLGRVMSSIMTINTSIMPIGTLVFSLLFDKVNNGALLLIINGIIMIVYSLWRLFKIKGANLDNL